MNRSNTVLIITEKKKEIRKGILNKIDRSVTKLTALYCTPKVRVKI
ncbi:hypothetical protein HV436_15530 [Bacillus sporothermodurans]|nr:hypothetical protein [Heyndrickxia sporothermodurans]MBL5847648.1 hypothetical protein [Heyndrickxia sporothermodurans]